MYEQNEVSAKRRLLWLIPAAVVLIAVIWLLVWLLFFRGGSSPASVGRPNTSQPHRSGNGSTTSPGTTSPSQSGSQPSTPAAGSSGQSGSTQHGTAQPAAPKQLSNTGPGNVLLPAAAASIAGSALYYIRLRRKELR